MKHLMTRYLLRVIYLLLTMKLQQPDSNSQDNQTESPNAEQSKTNIVGSGETMESKPMKIIKLNHQLLNLSMTR